VLLGLLAAMPGPAFTQTVCSQNCPVEVNKGFSVLFDAPGDGGTPVGYRLYLDGAKVGADIPATPGTVTVAGVLVSTVGTHQLQVSAFNATGEGQKTAALTLIANAPVPGIPSNLRIQLQVTIAQDGTFQIRVVGVESGSK